MKNKKTIAHLAFLFWGISVAQAQETTVAVGGDISGAGGTISYSVGQVSYISNQGTNYEINEGIQQPYSVNFNTVINENLIQIKMSVFPNPINSYIDLQIESEKLETLNYQLTDIQGKTISTNKITNQNTTIQTEALTNGIYFLTIIENNKSIKTFRIIKN